MQIYYERVSAEVTNFTSHFLQKICTTGDYILKLPQANKIEQLWSLQCSHFEHHGILKLNVS